MRVARRVNTPRLVLVARRIPKVLLGLCASCALAGLLGRSEFFIGTMYSALRWPLFLMVIALFLGFARQRHRIATIVSLKAGVRL